MILVTVGNTEFKFNRLFKIIDQLCDEKVLDGKKIIAQMGHSDYVPKNYDSFKFIQNDKFKEYLKKSDYVITHSGVGTIIGCLKNNKKTIVFPRLRKFYEHVDDHQIEIAESFGKSNYVLVAYDFETLKQHVKNINNFIPDVFVSNNDKINNLVIKLIEEM